MDICFVNKVRVLAISIPDSKYLFHDFEAQSRRDGVDRLLKAKADNMDRLSESHNRVGKRKSWTIEALFTFCYNNKTVLPVLARQTPR